MLEIRLLGPLRVLRDGQELTLPPSKKTRALLAYLATDNREHRRERLTRLFWSLPDDPRGALRWSLSRLRRLLDEEHGVRIRADRDTVRFLPLDADIDVARARHAARQSLDGLGERELEALARIFRGTFLEELDLTDAREFHAWVIAEREDMRAIEIRVRRRLLERLADRPERALDQARRLVELDPDHEPWHATLVSALLAAGRRGEAVAQQAASLRHLASVEVAPSPALRAALAEVEPSAALAAAGTPSWPAASPAAAPSRGAGFDEVPRTSILVMPFRNMSGLAEEDYFVDGMTEEITDALSRLPWLFVVAAGTAFTYRGRRVDVRQIGQELGVGFVLDGAVIRTPERIRFNYRLIDAQNGRHLWADRIERELSDLISAQDDIVGTVAGMVEPRLRLAELERSRRKPMANLEAYDHYLRGYGAIFGPAGMDYDAALTHLENALALEPEHAPSCALAAWLRVQMGRLVTPEGLAETIRLARTAAANCDDDGTVLANAAYVIGVAERDWPKAVRLVERALELNRNSAVAWIVAGWIHNYDGEPARGLEALAEAQRLSPKNPLDYAVQTGRALCFFQLNRLEEAAAAAERATADNPTFPSAWRVLAACRQEQGEADRAQAAVARLCGIAPHECIGFVRARLPYRDAALLDRLCAALAGAGLPDAAAPVAEPPARPATQPA